MHRSRGDFPNAHIWKLVTKTKSCVYMGNLEHHEHHGSPERLANSVYPFHQSRQKLLQLAICLSLSVKYSLSLCSIYMSLPVCKMFFLTLFNLYVHICICTIVCLSMSAQFSLCSISFCSCLSMSAQYCQSIYFKQKAAK